MDVTNAQSEGLLFFRDIMGIEAYKAVWANSKQTGAVKLTLLALAEFASEQNNWTCWPVMSDIAAMIGTNERQAIRNIQALEQAGEIIVTRSVGRGNANTYDLKPVIHDLKPVMDDTINEVENLSSMTQKPVMEGRKPVIHDLKPVMDDTPTINNQKEPEYNRNGYDRELPADQHPYPDEQRAYEEMLSAICRVVRQTYAPGVKEAGEFENTTYAFIQAGITTEQVLAFREWWQAHGYYKKPGKPYLKTLRDEIQNSIASDDLQDSGVQAIVWNEEWDNEPYQ